MAKKDIIARLKEDKTVWNNYQLFSDTYKRIRIAYIEAARKRPEEFEKRLNNFINKTRENKRITGFGEGHSLYPYQMIKCPPIRLSGRNTQLLKRASELCHLIDSQPVTCLCLQIVQYLHGSHPLPFFRFLIQRTRITMK
mgnify:CR=1 FL=1